MRKHAGTVIRTALYVLVIVILLFFVIGVIPNSFYRLVVIDGNSMAPTLRYGDLILVTPAVTVEAVNTIAVMSVDGQLVTHRIIGFVPEDGRPITKGDANKEIDHFEASDVRIVGVCRLRIPWLGYPSLYMQAARRGSG
jgi:signal peptidase I